MRKKSLELGVAEVMMRKGLLSLVVASLLLLGIVSSAEAESPIEGIWSFNGGKVAVEANADGSFRGVIVAPTKFSQCFHPVGEEVWSEIKPQADGSYWGLHQWYFETSECVPNPERGLTAFRVVTGGDGSKSLEVCFSEPGSKSQPKIPPSGSPSGATYGCSNSARISPLPTVVPTDAPNYILLPGNGLCLTRPKLKVRLRDPSGDPIVLAKVRLRSGKVRRRAKLTQKTNGIVATLNLRGLTKPKFTVSVKVTTALGHHLQRQRAYRLCGPVRAGRHHKHHG
ncbi:MAG TPA: hypothetical protein VFN85_00685 [Solirubrobacterales bacterium]|nr:hypothetical protein [Solirubrobacterales bacterium]